MKKALALALALMLVVGLFAGCGSTPAASSAPAASGSTSAESKPAETVTIKVSGWDMSTAPLTDNLVKAFEAANPNIKVELIDIASADYSQKLSVMLNGGSELDAFWIKDADTTKSLFDKGQLENLAPFIEKDGVDIEAYNGLVNNFKMPGGEIVGLPARTDYYVLYYNKDIFDAAKEPYPTNDMTWDEFREVAKRITSGEGATKNYGALIHTWQACVQNWGVQDGKHTIMDDDLSFFKPYYEMALGMQNDDKSIPDFATLKTGNIHYSSPFLTGNIGMMPMGSWFMTTMIAKKDAGESTVNWGVAALPHAEDVPAGYTVGAATPLVVNAASTKKEAAWEFVKFATSEAGAKVYADGGAIPGRSSDETLKVIAEMKGMPEGALEALGVTNISFDRPMADFVPEVNKMLEEEHSLIMLSQIDLDAGLAEMAERSKEIQGK